MRRLLAIFLREPCCERIAHGSVEGAVSIASSMGCVGGDGLPNGVV